MKHFKFTYYLLLLCFTATACTNESGNLDLELEEQNKKMEVQLTIRFPETVTRVTDEGTISERTINNIHLYAFEANGDTYTFKEEVEIVNSDNANISGTLKKKYTQNIRIVSLVNFENKGLEFSELPTSEGVTISQFYDRLIFSRIGNGQWATTETENRLPMWGECNMNIPQHSTSNSGSLFLTRAVAKVCVTVDIEKLLEDNPDFQMKSIEVYQYNSYGYGAPNPTSTDKVHIPEIAAPFSTPLKFNLSDSEKYSCKNRIYILEQKNCDVTNNNQRVYLKLFAQINKEGDIKEFRINFKEKGTGADFDLLRNNIYQFNIENINVNATLKYNVIEWNPIEIEIPPFN